MDGTRDSAEVRTDVMERMDWWLNDMAFKPPELLGSHYFECWKRDIADVAVDDLDFHWSAQRLDPPLTERS